jgi:hypothetical protein
VEDRDRGLGQAHESALKEAETDAMKRALMAFGNPFGLALHNKQKREGTTERLRLIAAVPPKPAEPKPKQEAQATVPSLQPLDPAAIEQILATLRGLPRPLLEEFTTGFRRRFQVPSDVTTIAGRITQQRHHDWIEAFLVRH